ncbi:MobF family relaxase [Methylophilus methylotrophus]|uniref:MobF family relaxase n=1 Tax=Methylophilus methylotrophus TaxID=17 RepID=UPI000366BDF3|nr:MobF family relaxase [Methylophilus methylotrophus]
MISIGKINNVSYHLDHSQHDYYSENDNEQGIFKGTLMRYQGLENKPVTEKQYLKQIDFGGENNKGIDICFSPPKDWTLIYNLSDEETRLKMDVYRDKAVNAICRAIEQNTYIRKTENNKTTFELAKAVGIATFNHHTSREVNDKIINPLGVVDAQEHTHFTVFPKVLGKDNKYHSHTLLQAKYEKHNGHETIRYFDQVGQYELAKGLQELGFNLYEADKHGNFAVKGITDELRDNFSKRSEQINKLAGENADYSKKQEVSLKVRAKKDSHNLEDLRSYWQGNAKALGFDKNKLESIKEKQTSQDKTLNELMKDRKATVSMKKLKTLSLSNAKFSNKTNTEKLEEFKKDNKLSKFTKNNFVYSKNAFITKSLNTFNKSSQSKTFAKLSNRSPGTSTLSQSKPQAQPSQAATKAQPSQSATPRKPASTPVTTSRSGDSNKTATIGDIKRLELSLLSLDPLDPDYMKHKGAIEEQIAQLKEELSHSEKSGTTSNNDLTSNDYIESLSQANEIELNNKLLELEDKTELTEGQINKKLNEIIEFHNSINKKLNEKFINNSKSVSNEIVIGK